MRDPANREYRTALLEPSGDFVVKKGSTALVALGNGGVTG